MELNVYFNEKYISSDEYVKLCVELHDRGMFAVVVNPKTGKTQSQRFIYNNHGRKPFNIYGRNRLYCINAPDYLTLWRNGRVNDEMKNHFVKCINMLHYSFKKYLELDTGLSEDDLNQVNDLIDQLINQFTLTSTVAEVNNNPVWVDLDHNSMTEDELSEIAQKITKEKNPAEGILYKGKSYRIFEKPNGVISLQQLVSANRAVDYDANTSQDNAIANKIRKYIQMAKVINANGLSEVVNGNFYPIVDTPSFNGKNYITIKINDDETRVLNQDRVKLINVFIEKP